MKRNYFYEYNLQGDVIGLLTEGYDRELNRTTLILVGNYQYDAWGNPERIETVNDPNGVLEKNPYRYRGYYYDNETGWYYLQSRYYNPEVRRFLNADIFASTGQNTIGSNMYAYCLNNPGNLADESGTVALVDDAIILAGVIVYGVTMLVSVWGLYLQNHSGTGILGVPLSPPDISISVPQVSFEEWLAAKIESIQKALGLDIADSKTDDSKQKPTFPFDPDLFSPKGLEKIVHVVRGSGKNGGIIKWRLLATNIAIFEWDEDYKNGSHYHCMLPTDNNMHNNGPHYKPGNLIPEPWASLYF